MKGYARRIAIKISQLGIYLLWEILSRSLSVAFVLLHYVTDSGLALFSGSDELLMHESAADIHFLGDVVVFSLVLER